MSYALPNVPEVTVPELVRDDLETMQLVDVRELDEWQAGHIPTSVHIPLAEVAMRIAELDPGRPVVAVCQSGVRSLYAVEFLQRSGFRDARSLAGGILAWTRAGQPLAVE